MKKNPKYKNEKEKGNKAINFLKYIFNFCTCDIKVLKWGETIWSYVPHYLFYRCFLIDSIWA